MSEISLLDDYRERRIEGKRENPHDKGNGAGGPGGPGGTETMEGRVAALEERLKHLPTKAGMYLSIGAAVVTVTSLILSVTIYLHGDLKTEVRSIGEGVEANSRAIQSIAEDVSFLKGRDEAAKN